MDLPSDSLLDRLADFVVDRDADPTLELDAWLSRHPELHEDADDLRAAWDAWSRGSAELSQVSTDPWSPLGLQRGQRIGNFELVELLGRGGQAVVWEARQLTLERRVALKILRPDRVSERGLALLRREARAGAQLSHEGIVLVHDFAQTDDVAWIAQELVPGGRTLRERIEEVRHQATPLDSWFDEVATRVRDVARALHVAHETGIIHRDVKPQNILLTPEGRTKIGDFGLARLEDVAAFSETGQWVGTHLYMSPEQVAGRRDQIDHRTDVFSLGVVLYELLTLAQPFEGDTPHQISMRIVHEQPLDPRERRSRVPRDLATICNKALEKHPAKRYATMERLAADLDRFLAKEPILARPPGAFERTVRWVRRHPTVSAAAAIFLAAFLVVGFLLDSNLRANHALSRTVGERNEAIQSLKTTNDALERAKQDAERAAESERLRADEVLRLSAFQELDDLRQRAEELWPPHPALVQHLRQWCEDADELTQQLPDIRRQLERLCTRALPLEEPDRQMARRRVAGFDELRRVTHELSALLRAQAVRAVQEDFERHELELDVGGVSVANMVKAVLPLIEPERRTFGREAEGLARAQRAERNTTDPDQRAICGQLVAYGLFAVGLDDEALSQARSVLGTAPAEMTSGLEDFVIEMERLVQAWRDGGEAARIAELERRRAELERRIDKRIERPFADDRDRWWYGQLVQLTVALDAFVDPDEGLNAEDATSRAFGWSVPKRLAFAERLHGQEESDSQHSARWRETQAAIAAHEAYGGLVLERQAGLVPLGPDPSSGLWEFWHPATGDEPRKDERGAWRPAGQDGIVFVLLPGGTFLMGGQNQDPAGPNFDPYALVDEGPVHEVELSPFFLSKYEMTQGQWLRLAGWNESSYGPDGRWFEDWLSTGAAATYDLPVSDVTWNDCTAVLPRVGLHLPTEAQLEYGYRAGTNTIWSSGDEFVSLDGFTNLADRYTREHGSSSWIGIQEWLDDGASVCAPIGTYRPNRFGLFEVHGNVLEFCADGYHDDFYSRSPRRDPVAAAEGPVRVVRGGSFTGSAQGARSAARANMPATSSGHDFGVRPAMSIRLGSAPQER